MWTVVSLPRNQGRANTSDIRTTFYLKTRASGSARAADLLQSPPRAERGLPQLPSSMCPLASMRAVRSQAYHPCHQCKVHDPLVSRPGGNVQPPNPARTSQGIPVPHHLPCPPNLSFSDKLSQPEHHHKGDCSPLVYCLVYPVCLKTLFPCSRLQGGCELPHTYLFTWAGRELNELQVPFG